MDTVDTKGNRERFKHKIQEDKFNKISPLLERERKLDKTIIRDIEDLFWEFHFLRKCGQQIEPFDPVRIEAHLRLSGIEVSKWEYKLLMEMDLIYRATVMNRG
ncbi:hypothetical protein COPG_00059 [Colwellia phage 9A]|uniref:Uncharacterized protein n=1 Tax=Colwellia phage 9A TaxID=765765 RepID=I3UME0_9CAUD|nr:hypothetical protein COPG_00059 [Colwellia phage 9A]AFK66655.1 hypothetical protein COPG_00059 [Colwellia phage 9A]